jgi:glycosyltransferase involved in cell wall biosynthesis
MPSVQNYKAKSNVLRVLIVGPALPIIGGQTVQAARLLDAFSQERGLRVDFQPINPRFLSNLQRIKYVRTLVTSLKFIADLLRKVPTYDVVHIFSASYYSFLLSPTPALLISKFFRKKTILNYRSGEARDHLTRWKWTSIPTIKMFDKVITPSGYLVDVFREFDISATSIFNSVDLEQFRFRERKTLSPIFLSNRNFERHYNVECTLRAFKLIQNVFPTASLNVIGDGTQRATLEALALQLDLKNVVFIGSVSPEEMPRYYDSADVYLNSPNIDNMPNSVIEAFACGLPVVSTNAGGIPYVVDNERTGLLVEVNDYMGLANAAVRLFKDEGLAARLISAARIEVQKYSWENVRQEWLRVYSEIAGGKSWGL